MVRSQYLDVLRSARTRNGVYTRRRLLARNRACVNAVHPDAISGPAYDQQACQNSQAQEDLNALASSVCEYFEDRVEYQVDPDPDRSTWAVAEYRPRSADLRDFKQAVHPQYSRSDFNTDEWQFAEALDASGQGLWMRNPATADTGFSIPLPIKVGDSTRFYPDFLWWVNDVCWAIDTTGKHLMSDKVRGKLIPLDEPKVALVVRGHIDLNRNVVVDRSGWTAVVARSGLSPLVEHSEDLQQLLQLFTS